MEPSVVERSLQGEHTRAKKSQRKEERSRFKELVDRIETIEV